MPASGGDLVVLGLETSCDETAASVVRVTPDEIDLRVTDVRPGGANLKAGKG